MVSYVRANGSSNFDEQVFEDPYRLDLTRLGRQVPPVAHEMNLALMIVQPNAVNRDYLPWFEPFTRSDSRSTPLAEALQCNPDTR